MIAEGAREKKVEKGQNRRERKKERGARGDSRSPGRREQDCCEESRKEEEG
jgi:hypothetical protein